jgi:hypothetical protein
MAEGEGIWVYGVVGADAPVPDGLAGVDGRHPVELVQGGGVAALASAVPLDEFSAEALRSRLEDLERLEALARAHERVLEAALAHGPVVPFRLCTIYESRPHLADMLGREGERLAAALARLDGVSEWGVKAFLASPAAAAAAAPGAEAGAARSGTDYLRRRREQRAAAEAARDATDAALEVLHARLAEQAADAVLSRPQDPRLSGRAGEMVLNGAYLLANGRVEGFRALVESLAREHAQDGLELELTGPWPAYHFVEAA